MQVIGCAAQISNGKDVLCDYIAERLGKTWVRSAFAKPVKEIYMKTFNKDNAFIEKWKRNPNPPPGMLKNVRESLQFIGDGFRQIDPYVWINYALDDESKKSILSDARYFNEGKAIKEKGGFTIVLYRPGFINYDPNGSEAEIRPIIEFCAKHLKHGPIPNFLYLKEKYGNLCPDAIQYYDYFFVNDENLTHLYHKVDNLLVPVIREKYAA